MKDINVFSKNNLGTYSVYLVRFLTIAIKSGAYYILFQQITVYLERKSPFDWNVKMTNHSWEKSRKKRK